MQVESVGGRDVVAGEIIVRFRDGAVQAASRTQEPGISSAQPLTPARAMLLRSSNLTVSELLQQYVTRPEVLYAEPNYIWRKQDVPNDVFFEAQWGLRNSGQQISNQTGTAGADIGAVQAWDIAQGSRSFVIGIVDSGVDYNHPDLAANIWSAPAAFNVVIGGQFINCAAGTHGFNAILRTCDPMDDDSERHGTHVAGIVGADGDNGLGISGVSRVANMMALKFLRSDGGGTTADAIAAIEFAIQAKAHFGAAANVRILNNSWGGSSFSQALLDAIESAANNNMLFVASAGNDSVNTDLTPHYPSGHSAANIISVAATDNRDGVYPFSNFGVNTVHLGAPGRAVASSVSVMTYAFRTGTSMAAASVSGAAGLVLSGCPGLSTAQLKATLLGAVDPLPTLEAKTATGGRLNVHRALVNCAGAPPVFTLKTSSGFLPAAAGGSAASAVTLNALNGFSANVTLAASAPPGITISLGTSVLTPGSASTSVTVATESNITPGSYVIHITGTSGNVSRTAGLVVIVGSPISSGQIVAGIWSGDASQPDRFRSGNVLPPGLMDWYEFTLNSTASVNISSRCFCAGNQLKLLNSSGAVLAMSDTGAAQISRTLAADTYFIVASTASNATLAYSLAVNSPELQSLIPSSGQQGSSLNVHLTGMQFVPGLTIDAGSDITVSNIVVSDSRSAIATFIISPAAALGPRAVSVITPAATSNAVTFTVNLPAPVITSLTPSSGVVGTSVEVAILGSHFVDPIVTLNTSGGSFLGSVNVVSTSMITVTIVIPANGLASTIIRIQTAGGIASASFRVLPLPPTLTSISPSSGSLGTAVDVTLTGGNFYAPLTINAGNGIAVTNLSIAPDRSSAAARFNISPTASIGVRDITVTAEGGTSGSVAFAVVPGGAPTLSSLTPANGGQSTTRVVDVRGTNFTTGFTFSAGPDIVVSAVTVVNSTQASVTLQIGSTAALGPRDVTVGTLGGTSNSLVFTVLLPPPTLSSISPSSGGQESAVDVIVTGTNFVPGLAFQAAPLTVNQISVLSSISASAVVTIPANTAIGNYSVTAVTASGSSAALAFTVLPGAPSLTEIRPAYGTRGHDVQVLLRGRNFAKGVTTISPIPGIEILSLSSGTESINATFRVAPDAPVGPHTLSVMTPGGTTGGMTFSIFDPFPDVRVGSGGPLEGFYPGTTGTYAVEISNSGVVPATKVIVTDLLPPELTFVSGGSLWVSCSAAGQLVTCSYFGPPIDNLSTQVFTITVAISSNAPASVTHTVSASYAGDLYPDNNSVTAVIPIVQELQAPILAFGPVSAGQQASVSLRLPTPLPHEVSGTLLLKFSPAPNISFDDPAIEFAAGGRVVPFTISAYTFNARFANASTAGPALYQAGTTAGSISFDGTMRIGSLEKSFSSPVTSQLTIAPAPPVINSIRTQTQGGFAALITSYSTPHSITQLSLQFFTTPTAQLSCGSVSGCTVSGSTITFNVSELFGNWFTTSSQFGGVSTLRVPLMIEGIIRGSVNVTLRNDLGASNSVFFPLP